MTGPIDEALALVAGCEQHDHSPVAIEMQKTKWNEMVHEYHKHDRHKWCLSFVCENDECKAYRRQLALKPGDDAGKLWGIEVRIVPDVPLMRVIEP